MPANKGDFKHLGFDADGVKEDFHFDEASQTVTLARTHMGQASPFEIIEKNKAFQNSGQSGYSSDKTFKHVASIPIAVVELWTETYGVNPTEKGNERLLSRLLNSSEWQWLRTGSGRLDLTGN